MTTLPTSAIAISEDRQRTELDLTSLRSSIQKRGIITPIVVTNESPPRLVAGERRLRCAIELGLAEVPVRWLDELDPIELQIIELEENIKRKSLTWQEDVRATERIHRLYGEQTSGAWTQVRTAESIGLDQAWISRQLRVARDLEDPNVAKCGTTNEAYNLLMRRDERARASQLDGLLAEPEDETDDQTEQLPFEERTTSAVVLDSLQIKSEGDVRPPEPSRPRLSTGIVHADFGTWWRTWRGPKFNLVHCDLPYGIGLFNASGVRAGASRAQIGQDEGESYDDGPEVYERLVDEVADAINAIASSSCHIMFWFSNKWSIEQWTRQRFADLCPQIKWSHYPLVWLKTDNAGVAAIPSQQPRHIYEMALFGTIGDRPLVRLKSDAYAAQTDKSLHVSCKPQPMLRHFMEMLVDEHTVMLDPTCGSGTSVRAAESLGAKLAIGLEVDPKMAEMAERARAQEESKRKASGTLAKIAL